MELDLGPMRRVAALPAQSVLLPPSRLQEQTSLGPKSQGVMSCVKAVGGGMQCSCFFHCAESDGEKGRARTKPERKTALFLSKNRAPKVHHNHVPEGTIRHQ